MNRIIPYESSECQKYPVSSNKWKHISTSFWSLSFLAFFLTMTPLLAQGPKFYGLTSQGGKDGTGAIIEYDINSQTLTDPAPTGFTNFSPGKPLYNDLTEFNGKLYGLTFSGGAYFSGVLFEFNPEDGVYTKKHDFIDNDFPIGGLTELNGKLYGTTSGGINNAGVIFEFDPLTDVYSEKHVFSRADSPNGVNPSGSLVNLGGTLFGMTTLGGVNGLGVIFSFDPTTNDFSKLHDFDGTDGAEPRGGLTVYDGKLYGTTNKGGRDDNGIIFVYSNGEFTNLKSFFITAQSSDALGGSLTLYGDKLYGTTPKGGIAGSGLIFWYDPLTNTLESADEFVGVKDGSTPFGSLTVFNDKLYGMTSSGGDGDVGVLFEFDPLTKGSLPKRNFEKESGSIPLGSLVVFDGKLFGMTSAGGVNDSGVIFEYTPATELYTPRIDFERTNGSFPSGSLTKYNGKLFGTADGGGENNLGVIFEYDPTTETYTKNFDFDGANGNYPIGSLTEYNGKLYGVTSEGGRFVDHGLIYEYDPISREFTKLIQFDGTNGSSPSGSITEYNGILYGLTSSGGTSGVGVLFGYDPSTRGFMLYDFDGTTGVSPRGSLTVYNGKLYGTTSGGGSANVGILFEFDPLTGEITEKYSFIIADGALPYGGLIVYNDKLLGLTSDGGSSNAGVLFEYDLTLNKYSKKHDFNDLNGRIPFGSLTEYNGKLYGMTQAGGVNGRGVVFEYDPVNEVYAKNADFNLSNGAFPFGSLTLFTPPPAELNLSATKEDEFCPGRNGSIDLTIIGASGTPVISWTGPDLFTASVEDLNNLSAGIYKVVVTDDAGATGSFEVEILLTPDTEAPVPPAAPADLNLQCASEVPPVMDLTAIDNCDGEITVSPSIQLKPGASPNDFEFKYIWTFVDALGNLSSISQTIIVKDDIAPVPPVAPADLNLQCGSDLPPVVDLTGIDNCSGPITVSPTVTITPGASQSDFVEVRTWTFVDADGNSSSVSQRIVVRDNIPPSFEFCSGDINETVAFGETGKIINYLPAVASDNCSVPAIVLTSGLASGSVFPLGTTTVTYVATDEAGNSAECSFDVTVTADPDTEDPLINNCPPDYFVTNDVGECGAIFRLTEPTATDNSGFVDFVSNFEPGDFLPVGTTRVTYTATDAAGNQATCSFDVTVVDNELPVFGAVSDINVTVPSGQTVTSVSVPEPPVSDNCSAIVIGERNDGMQLTDPYPLGETTIIWSAKDPSGNDAVGIQQKVIVTQINDNQRITRFVLVNSQTDVDLFEITEGMEIDSELVKGMQLNIRAETNPTVVGSVFMRLTGPVGSTKTENVAPYALFGDSNGNYSGRSLPNGNYTMSAVPYTLSGRSGEEGVALTVNFSIVRPAVPVSGISVDPATAEIATGSTVQLTATIQPSNASNKAVIWGSSNSDIASVNSDGLVTGNTPGQAFITATSEDGGLTASATITVVAVPNLGIVSFTLINSDTDVDMFELTNGMVINQSTINGIKLNVRVNTNPSIVGSVYFTLSGPVSTTRTENDAPYALFGDKNGNYSGKTLSPGTYTLTARAYSESKRRGTAGPLKTITFTIVSNAFRTETETNKPENGVMENENPAIEIQGAYTLKAFPNPVQDGRVSIVDSRFREGKVKYILYSITGSKLSEGEAEIGEGKTIRLDFSGYVTQAGMYILILDYDKYPSLQRVQLIFE